MTIETSRAGNEAQIRERIEGWAKALRAKDVDAVMSYYTRDVLSFDLAAPAVTDGRCGQTRLGRVVPDVPRSDWLRDSRPEHHRR